MLAESRWLAAKRGVRPRGDAAGGRPPNPRAQPRRAPAGQELPERSARRRGPLRPAPAAVASTRTPRGYNRSRPATFKAPLLASLLCGALAFELHANSLSGSFLFDEKHLVLHNPLIRSVYSIS